MSKWIWLGLMLGSALGGWVPTLWDRELLSLAGIAGSTVGGALGVLVGYRIGRSM